MEEQLKGPDPFPVDRMNAEERLADLGRILAAGIWRMRGAEPESDGPCCINHRTSAEYPYP